MPLMVVYWSGRYDAVSPTAFRWSSIGSVFVSDEMCVIELMPFLYGAIRFSKA